MKGCNFFIYTTILGILSEEKKKYRTSPVYAFENTDELWLGVWGNTILSLKSTHIVYVSGKQKTIKMINFVKHLSEHPTEG